MHCVTCIVGICLEVALPNMDSANAIRRRALNVEFDVWNEMVACVHIQWEHFRTLLETHKSLCPCMVFRKPPLSIKILQPLLTTSLHRLFDFAVFCRKCRRCATDLHAGQPTGAAGLGDRLGDAAGSGLGHRRHVLQNTGRCGRLSSGCKLSYIHTTNRQATIGDR